MIKSVVPANLEDRHSLHPRHAQISLDHFLRFIFNFKNTLLILCMHGMHVK